MPLTSSDSGKAPKGWLASFDEWREYFYNGFHTTTTAAFFADLFFGMLQAEEGVIDASYSRVNGQIVFTLIFMTFNGVAKTYAEPFMKNKKQALAGGIKELKALKNQLKADYDRLFREVELLEKAKGSAATVDKVTLKKMAKLMEHLNKQYDKNPGLKLIQDSVKVRREIMKKYGKNFLYSFINYLSEFNRLSFGPILTLVVFNFFLQNIFKIAGTNYYIGLAMTDSIYLGAKALIAAYSESDQLDFDKTTISQEKPTLDSLPERSDSAINLSPISSDEASMATSSTPTLQLDDTPCKSGSIDEFAVLFNQCNALVKAIYGEYIIDPPSGSIDNEDHQVAQAGLIDQLNTLLSTVNDAASTHSVVFNSASKSELIVANSPIHHKPNDLVGSKNEKNSHSDGNLATTPLLSSEN